MNTIPTPGHDDPFLDEEEQGLITDFEAAIEHGKLLPQTAAQQKDIRDEWRGILENTQKRKAVTLRLQERDIRRVKTIAREMGMPYQTYLASVVHRIATGDIVIR